MNPKLLAMFPVVAVLALGVRTAKAEEEGDDDHFESGQAIVELVPGATIEAFNAAFGTTTLDSMPERPLYLVAVPEGQGESDFELAAEQSPLVREAYLDYLGAPSDPGSDTRSIYTGCTSDRYANAEPFALIGLAPVSDDGAGSIVALIDGGVDAAHPGLMGRVLTGYNFVNNTTQTPDVADGTDSNANTHPDETFGHGTFVAGLIAATAPDARIIPFQVMDSDGRATAFRVARALYAATDARVDIVNISLSSIIGTELVEEAVEYANEHGVIVVASVGNTGRNEIRYPAGYHTDLLVGVAATDNADVLAPFSTFGEAVSLTAPGVDLVSLTPRGWPAGTPDAEPGFASASGTSFSAPLVTGALALARSACPTISPRKLRRELLQSARDLDAANPGLGDDLGAGRLDVRALLYRLPCCPDFSGDGQLNLDDLDGFVQAYLAGDPSGDLNDDGSVNFDDLDAFVQRFISGCE